jgi:uncharacterized protein YbjT (DUF2867 family)
MSSPTVAIFGGTGQTGAAVAVALEARGAVALRLSRRDVDRGASALEGVDVAYVIAPNMHLNEPRLVGEYLDLIHAAGVRRLGYHSVAAPYAPSMRHHLGKAASEDLVRRSGLDWTILQPCAYIQNFLPAPDATELRVPFAVDALFGMVDLADVGEAAAIVCVDSSHTGATYELGGPRLISIEDAAEAAGSVLGHRVEPVAETAVAWVRRAAAGLSEDTTGMFLAMWDYYDRYGLPTGAAPLAGLLGRPSRSFAQVLEESLASGPR